MSAPPIGRISRKPNASEQHDQQDEGDADGRVVANHTEQHHQRDARVQGVQRMLAAEDQRRAR